MFRRNISFHPAWWSRPTHTPVFFRSVPAVYDAVPRWRFSCFLPPAVAPPARSTLPHPRTQPWLHPRQLQAPPGRFLFRGEAPPPALNLTGAAAETLKQQEAISADRGTALPFYVSARHVVQPGELPHPAPAESAGAEALALYENKAVTPTPHGARYH